MIRESQFKRHWCNLAPNLIRTHVPGAEFATGKAQAKITCG